MVDGGTAVTGIVGCVLGTNVDDVGGGSVVVVVGGGGSVVPVVVCTGGEVVAGALVPTLRGAVVTTPGWVFPVPPDGRVTTVVVLEVVDVGPLDVVVAPDVVDVGRRVDVVVGDWVATCCLGDVSLPVATSKSMAARAMVART